MLATALALLSVWAPPCRAGVTALLGRVPPLATVEESMLKECLRDLAHLYRYDNPELVIMFRDTNFDVSRFSQFWSRLTVREDIHLGISFKTRSLRTPERIAAVLKSLRWSRRTLFMIVMKRERSKGFYAAAKDQSSNVEEMVRKEDLERDFPGAASGNNTRLAHEMRIVLREFWNSRITNVVVLVPQERNVYFYTYFPFTDRNCPDRIAPVLTNVWSSDTGRFYRTHNLYPNKVKNVNRCVLNVSLLFSPPGIMAERGRIDGIEGELLKYVFRSLNATPRFHFVNSQEASMNDSETAVNYLLANIRSGESELGAGFLIPTYAYTGSTEDIYVGISLCLTWAVPNSARTGNSVSPITDAFTPPVWILLLSTTVLSSLILWFLLRKTEPRAGHTFLGSAFRILAVTLGKSVPLPENKLARGFLICFVWYSIILCSAFQAGIGSNNLISDPPNRLHSTEDIVESGFEIAGVESTVHLFKDDIKLIRRNGRKVHVEPMEIHNALMKVAFERRTAYIGLRLAISYYILFLNPELMGRVFVHKSCLVNYQPFFALRKNSPFTIDFRGAIFGLIENGMKDKLVQKYMARMAKEGSAGRRVESKENFLFHGGMIILAVGLCFSGVAFLGECAHAFISKRSACTSRSRTCIKME